jgi:riboflavin biosynthesis pyrimidine reductase
MFGVRPAANRYRRLLASGAYIAAKSRADFQALADQLAASAMQKLVEGGCWAAWLFMATPIHRAKFI